MTEYTDREAYEVGVLQKQYINWILLVYSIAFFIPYATWVAGIAVAYFVFKIAEAQKSPVAWLWALSQVIPFVGLVCLLILSQNATRILRGKGIKVGLLGAKGGELDKLVPPVASARSSTSPQKSTYTIYGAHRDTGNDMNIKVQAFNEEEAINEANRCGILVSKVVAEDRSKISWPINAAWIKVAGGVVAVGLILVVLTQSVFLSEPAIEAKSNTGVSSSPPTLSRSNTAVMTTMHKLQSAQIRVRQHHKDMETREQLDAFYAEYMNELNRINISQCPEDFRDAFHNLRVANKNVKLVVAGEVSNLITDMITGLSSDKPITGYQDMMSERDKAFSILNEARSNLSRVALKYSVDVPVW